MATTGGTGAVSSARAYSPFGEADPPPGGVFGYTGRQYDAETGLYQYRARYYHPRLGQFLSTDPIGTKDDPNLTGYVGNDPVNASDPTGMRQDRFDQLARRRDIGDAAADRQNREQADAVLAPFRAIADAVGQVTGAIGDFGRNFNDMVEADTIGGDKFFHCSANCEATTRGPLGEGTAVVISEGREFTDSIKYTLRGQGSEAPDSSDDQAANRQGRDGAQRGQPEQCRIDVCASRSPRGLPDEY